MASSENTMMSEASDEVSVSTSPTPPPSEMDQLAVFFGAQPQQAVLEHCLGISQIPAGPALADKIIVVCFDTEAWTGDSSKVTEVGLATFDSRDMRAQKTPSPHGENYLKQVYFYHLRMQDNAHFINKRYCPGDPEKNRFGQTRFLTPKEAQGCLTECFGWYIDANKPELGYCPVIVMGHALSHDLSNLDDKLGFNPYGLGNIVKVIDTQQLARETGFWSQRNPISLENLVDRCNFKYRDPHTACNDAAMTLIAAIQMVLPQSARSSVGKSLQDVVDAVEKSSESHTWAWGSAKFCVRCGSRNHTWNNPPRGKKCKVVVHCQHCEDEGKLNASYTHRTECCINNAIQEGIRKRGPPKIEIGHGAYGAYGPVLPDY